MKKYETVLLEVITYITDVIVTSIVTDQDTQKPGIDLPDVVFPD